jgi:hypothetical protein
MDISCTLTSADLAAQRERWLRLIAAAGAGREETPAGLRLRFRPDAGVARELERLAAVERECCAWATWTVSASADAVILAVASSGAGVAALHGMFTRAWPAHPPWS